MPPETGGFVRKSKSEQRLSQIPQKVLLAMPVDKKFIEEKTVNRWEEEQDEVKSINPEAPYLPMVSANSLNTLMAQVPHEFDITLRQPDGNTVDEQFKMTTSADLDLTHLAKQSGVLRDQNLQANFLMRFIEECKLQDSSAFYRQLNNLLSDEKRKQIFIEKLSEIIGAVEQKQRPLLDFLAQ